MNLSSVNTHVVENPRGYEIRIGMPDGSRNFLHGGTVDLDSAIILMELLDGCSIDHLNLTIIRHPSYPKYYQLIANIEDCNKTKHRFHSRALNLNDVLFERMQLLTADE